MNVTAIVVQEKPIDPAADRPLRIRERNVHPERMDITQADLCPLVECLGGEPALGNKIDAPFRPTPDRFEGVENVLWFDLVPLPIEFRHSNCLGSAVTAILMGDLPYIGPGTRQNGSWAKQ